VRIPSDPFAGPQLVRPPGSATIAPTGADCERSRDGAYARSIVTYSLRAQWEAMRSARLRPVGGLPVFAIFRSKRPSDACAKRTPM